MHISEFQTNQTGLFLIVHTHCGLGFTSKKNSICFMLKRCVQIYSFFVNFTFVVSLIEMKMN